LEPKAGYLFKRDIFSELLPILGVKTWIKIIIIVAEWSNASVYGSEVTG
jgi:hypothetical protein